AWHSLGTITSLLYTAQPGHHHCFTQHSLGTTHTHGTALARHTPMARPGTAWHRGVERSSGLEFRARWLKCLHCRLTARRSWVRFPHGALLALGGRSSPECTVLRWAISPGPFCVEFACSPRIHKGFPPLRTPTEKTCKITEHMSIPDQR